MENNIKLKVLDSIGKVYEKSKECKLEPAFFEMMNTELKLISDYFKISKSQALIVSMVFALNYKGETLEFRDLIDYFDCNPMKILEYNEDFNYLLSAGIIIKQKSSYGMRISFANNEFVINEKITEAILQNKPMPEIHSNIITDIFELLERLSNIKEQRNNGEISTHQLLYKTHEITAGNMNFPLIKRISSLNLNTKDRFLYLYMIWKTVSGRETTDVARTLDAIYDNTTQRLNYMQDFLSGNNILVKNNLIEIVEAQFFNDTEMKLTDFSIDFIKECGIKLFVDKKKKDNVFSPLEIPFRKLLFDKEVMKQLFLLKDLLKGDKFKKMQHRLTDKNLPVGVIALLHGFPGTGKTEVVKQMARESKRELMKVEISQFKSMWYGESEKVVKRIFTDYKMFAKECKRTPILLFNEADAIISKRRGVENSNVAQTENTIQNIILEEFENFEGILIATTNLVNNLDAAFERRFLFKIHFPKPDIAIRAKIWKSKLAFLNSKDCSILAENFDFSGGQIDNILRKNEIHEMIHGEKRSLDNLLAFCSEESLNSNKVKIGFIK